MAFYVALVWFDATSWTTTHALRPDNLPHPVTQAMTALSHAISVTLVIS